MPRTLAETMRLRGPFGGLMSARAKRQINPLDCLDSRNVHTVYGDIRRRPGFKLFAPDVDPNNNWRDGFYYVLKSVALGDYRLLYGWFQGHYQGDEPEDRRAQHVLFNDAGEIIESQFSDLLAPPPSVAESSNRLYMVNGAPEDSRKFYRTNGSILSARIGIEAAPTIGEVHTSDLYAIDNFPVGWYSYYITWYNVNADVEGGASPEARYEKQGPPNPYGIRIEHPPSGPLDDQITHWRIYRMREGVDGIHHRVATVGKNVDYYDDLDFADGIDMSYLGELIVDPWMPPTSRAIAWHKRRMWWVVGKSRPTQVRWSEVDQPERVNPVNSLATGRDGSDFIVALFPAFGRLYVFKNRSIWAIFGDSPETFSMHRISSDAGCDAPRSIVEIGNALYFCNINGPYRLVGDRIEFLGADLTQRWENYRDSAIAHLAGVHEKNLGLYVITGEIIAGGWRQIAYDYRRHKWHYWIIYEMTTTCLHRPTLDHKEQVYFGLGGNRHAGRFRRCIGVLQPTGRDYSDMTQEESVVWYWETSDMDFGIERPKKVFFASLGYEGFSPDENTDLQLEYMHNSDGDYHPLGPAFQPQAGSHMVKRRVARLCDTIRFKLSGTSNGTDRIASLDIAATPIGHR